MRSPVPAARRAHGAKALILTYHAIELEGSPLCVDPELFSLQLDCIEDSGARIVTVETLAQTVRRGERPQEPTAAITFDDGFQSVVDIAAPLLVARGMVATVFCVAGHLGRSSDWATSRRDGFRRHLASASALRELAEAGFEIGSHGVEHAPLVSDSPALQRREIVDSKRVLEQAVGVRVSSFAYPYGASPSPSARRLVEATYEAACSTTLGLVGPTADPFSLPRVDAHYLRQAQVLRGALSGSLTPSLVARGIGARARRVLRKDYVVSTGHSGR